MAHNLPTEHEFVRPEQYLNIALAALERDTLLPRVFTLFDGAAFKGAPSKGVGAQLGNVLNYKLARIAAPAREYDWRTRTAPIILDRIGTVTQDIKLNKHIYHGVPITNEQLTFDLKRLGEEIVQPQVDQLRDMYERAVVKGLEEAPFKVVNANVASTVDPYKYALSLRKTANRQGMPQNGRILLVGDDVETWLLESDRLSRLQETGTTSALLRAQVIPNLAGFQVVRSSLIAPNAVYAVHPSALLVANVAPDLPLGEIRAARNSYKGMSFLLTQDYDPTFQQSRSVLSTFFGINSVNDELVLATQADVDDPAQPDVQFVGQPVFDADGNPQVTGKNVRGIRGQITGL